jgi:hypothetical protein
MEDGYDIRMDLREIWYEGLACLDLVPDKGQ